MTLLTTFKTSNLFFMFFMDLLFLIIFFLRFRFFKLFDFFMFIRYFPIRFLFVEDLRGWNWHFNAILCTKRA